MSGKVKVVVFSKLQKRINTKVKLLVESLTRYNTGLQLCFTGKKTANKNIEVTMHVLSDDGTILQVFVGWLCGSLQISR